MPSLIKRFAKFLYESLYTRDEIDFNYFHNDSALVSKTIELIYGEVVSMTGYPDFSRLTNAIRTQQYTTSTFMFSMIVKTFSRMYFFALFAFLGIYLAGSDLTNREKAEASFAVFFPFILTLVVVSLREYHFENRKANKDRIVNSQTCSIIRKFREDSSTNNYSSNSRISSSQQIQVNQSDSKNSSKIQIYEEVQWENIKIGDIVLLKKDEVSPADILILDMFDRQCTVGTQNIDDKTDEKIKSASQLLFCKKFLKSILINLLILSKKLEPKNSKMKGNHVEYKKLLTGRFTFKGIQEQFQGVVKLKKDPIAQELTSQQFIMRGSRVQFTEWLLGLVIEVGMQTYIYRKFKAPQLIYLKSNFMGKQFMFSVLCILILLLIILINVITTEVNICLSDGFINLDSKILIACLLQMPVYYHAISELLITIYCIYQNSKEYSQPQLLQPQASTSNLLHSSEEQGQQQNQTSQIFFSKDENANIVSSNGQTPPYSTVSLHDCLTKLNDTRSIVDLCLTSHVVINTANTLTTGSSSITALLVGSSIYQIDVSHFSSIKSRRKEKMDTIFLHQPWLRKPSIIQNQFNQGIQLNKLPLPSLAISSTSTMNLFGLASPKNPLTFGASSSGFHFDGLIMQHPSGLEKVDEEKKADISLLSVAQYIGKQDQKQQQTQAEGSNESGIDQQNQKTTTYLLDEKDKPTSHLDSAKRQNQELIDPILNKSSTIFANQHLKLLGSPKQKDQPTLAIGISSPPQLRLNTIREQSENQNNQSIVKMMNLQSEREYIDRKDLIKNNEFEKFLDSLDFHKKNNHRILQLNPKKMSEEIPFPESDGEINSPRRAVPVPKLNQSASEIPAPPQDTIKQRVQTEKKTILLNPRLSRSHLPDHIRSSVARGVEKTFFRHDDESGQFTINSSCYKNNGSNHMTLKQRGMSTSGLFKSVGSNLLSFGMENYGIFGSKEFITQHIDEESETYFESQKIVEALLLCHHTRSFFDEQTHKIINRSFLNSEELQLQLGEQLDYSFQFNCTIDGGNFYVLKNGQSYEKYEVIADFYSEDSEKFYILVKFEIDDECIYTIFIKQEVLNVSDIDYLAESTLSDLNNICQHYRSNGNRSILFSKKYLTEEQGELLIQRIESKENLGDVFKKEIIQGQLAYFVTVLAIKEQTVPGLESLFKHLKEADIKTWIATGEKFSKVSPICFSSGIIEQSDKNITFESEDYDKLSFQIKNVLQLLKEGFQKAHSTSKFTGSSAALHDINVLTELRQPQPVQNKIGTQRNGKRLGSGMKRSYSNTKPVRQTSRKSIMVGMEVEANLKFSILISGASLKIILNNIYLHNHFAFICYFAQTVVGFDLSPEQKAQLVQIINNKMNQDYKTLFVGNTLADFSAFTEAGASAYKKSAFSEGQNFPGLQFDHIENLLSLILFHSKMFAEICEDALAFNLYRGFLYVFIVILQYQLCEIDYEMVNLGSMVFLSFFVTLAQTLIIVAKKYKKYNNAKLVPGTLTHQFGTLKELSNSYIIKRTGKILIAALVDSILLFIFVYLSLRESTQTDSNHLFSIQLKNYSEQFLALSALPALRIVREYTFRPQIALLVSAILIGIPLIGFLFDPLVRETMRLSCELLADPQYVLTMLLIPIFITASTKFLLFFMRLKTFPLLKSFEKLKHLLNLCIRESYFIKPKQLNIAKLIREIFLNQEPDMILSSYILSESVNLREASMEKWSLKFKDENIETRFQSIFQKKTEVHSKVVSTLQIIFVEGFILYRGILIEDINFNLRLPGFYLVYFLGTLLMTISQIYIFFGKSYPKHARIVHYGMVIVRVVYFMVLINVGDIFDGVPGILICIFLSCITLPLIRLNFLFFTGVLVLLFAAFREFEWTNSLSINIDESISSLSSTRISLSHIEITFAFFIALLLQKRNYEETERKNFQVSSTLTQGMQKMRDTLAILLPRFIREKLYSGQNYDSISTNQGNIAVLFCDITNFDEIMLEEDEKIVNLLDQLFRQFDKSCQSNQVLKIETVGKTYMAAAGLKDIDEGQLDSKTPASKSLVDPVKRCIQVALEMMETANNTTWGSTGESTKHGKVQIKIGINYGTVISGVIGFHKPQFSLIGDTVNTASRVCSTGLPKTVSISASAYQRVSVLKLFKFTPRQVEAKGKGIITTYVVTMRKSTSQQQGNQLKKFKSNLADKSQDKVNQILKPNNSSLLPDSLSPKESIPIQNIPLQQSPKQTQTTPKPMESKSSPRKARQQVEFSAPNNQDMFLQTKESDLENINLLLDQKLEPLHQQSSHHGSALNQKIQLASLPKTITRNHSSKVICSPGIPEFEASEDENIEAIRLAEEDLDTRIEIEHISQYGLNLQFFDLKSIKQQYQEEKSGTNAEHAQLSQNQRHLELSYWQLKTNKQIAVPDESESMASESQEQEDIVSEFWTQQMYDTLFQLPLVLRTVFLQVFLYTLTLLFFIGRPGYNIIIAVRCVLLFFVALASLVSHKILKASSTSLQKFRVVVISSYLMIFAQLNVELWLSTKTNLESDYQLYNETEMRLIVGVLVYEIYFVYIMLLRLKIFTFIQHGIIFILTFFVLLAQNIVVSLMVEGIMIKIIFMQIFFILGSRLLFKKDIENFNQLKALNDQNQQIDKLIQYLLPSHILRRFLMNPTASHIIAEKFEKQTILFADIAGFTRYSDQNQPETVVKMLRTIFTQFDQMCQLHKVFKVYTIGDCYVILGNTNNEARNPSEEAYNVVMMAFKMIEILSHTLELVDNQIDMRIGIHTGKIVGGLVGTQIVRYDIYGVDVMIANKMESNGQKGRILVSESAKDMIEERSGDELIFTQKDDVFIKAINSSIKTYICEKNPNE